MQFQNLRITGDWMRRQRKRRRVKKKEKKKATKKHVYGKDYCFSKEKAHVCPNNPLFF